MPGKQKKENDKQKIERLEAEVKELQGQLGWYKKQAGKG